MLAVLGVGPRAPATKRGLSGVLNDARRGQVHLARQEAHLVVVLRDRGGAEGVGLDQVGARGQVALVDVADHVGPREAEQLVVALHVLVEVLEALTPVLGLAQLEALDHGAHGAIEDGDAVLQDVGQRLGAGVGGRFHAPIVGRHQRPWFPGTLASVRAAAGIRRGQGLASTPMR
jgi:hypothetical protein